MTATHYPACVATILVWLVSMAALAESVDLVTVDKSERVMRLHSRGEVIREFAISLGASPVGHKLREGDERTPEGRYTLDYRNPNSSYYLSIHVSYPAIADHLQAAYAESSPGGDIFIHGLPNGMGSLGALFAGRDWTDGCIAVNDNEQMLDIWTLVQDGTPIHIRP